MNYIIIIIIKIIYGSSYNFKNNNPHNLKFSLVILVCLYINEIIRFIIWNFVSL